MTENILTIIEQIRRSAYQITREDYIKVRSRDWDVNAFRWAQGIDRDLFRTSVFEAVQRVVDLCLEGSSSSRPKVVDLGCGEGSFLRRCSQRHPDASFVGLDVCKRLLHIAGGIAHEGNVDFRRADFELDYDLDKEVTIVTAILSLIECVNLDVAFANIRRCLINQGIAIVVVLDPMREFMRVVAGDNSKMAIEIRKLDEDIVLIPAVHRAGGDAKMFCSRILYPIDNYISSANSAGLLLETVVAIEATGNSIYSKPRGLMMIFAAV